MKVYLTGTYGYESFGDDYNHAILRSRLSALLRDVSLTPDRTNPEPFSPVRHDALIFGGSGLIYSHTYECGTDNLRHLFRYPAAMQWFDRKTFGLAVGVQGNLPPSCMAPYREVIETLNLLTVRDRTSSRKLRDAGIRTPILECADLCYLADPIIRSGKERERPVLGVVASQPDAGVIYQKTPDFEVSILEAIRKLSATFELRFLSCNKFTDGWLAQTFNAPITEYDPTQADSAAAITRAIAGLDFLLTTRLHGAILAAVNGIPFVAMGAQEEKLEVECQALDHPFFLPYACSAGEITATVQDAWSERETLRETIRRSTLKRRRLATRSFDLLLQRLNEAAGGFQANAIEHEVSTTGRPKGTLVVWAAGDDLWEESAIALAPLASFDCLTPTDSRITSPHIAKLIRLPFPGLMHWQALGSDVKQALADKYECVVVAHDLPEGKSPAGLMDIAIRSGKRHWEFNVWTQRARSSGRTEAAAG